LILVIFLPVIAGRQAFPLLASGVDALSLGRLHDLSQRSAWNISCIPNQLWNNRPCGVSISSQESCQ
jgi:hypothetical protein